MQILFYIPTFSPQDFDSESLQQGQQDVYKQSCLEIWVSGKQDESRYWNTRS